MPLDLATLTPEQLERFRALPPEVQAELVEDAAQLVALGLSPRPGLLRWRQRPGRKPK